MRKDKTIYRLTIEDIQNVALDCLNRKLTKDEIDDVCDSIGNYIPWYDAIENSITLLNINK